MLNIRYGMYILLAALVAAASSQVTKGGFPFGQAQKAGHPSRYGNKAISERCFCELEGKVEDCECNVAYVDDLNNNKLYPRLASLLRKNYFRFYKVNLHRKCPFWDDNDGKCSVQACAVEECPLESLPAGLQAGNNESIKLPASSVFGPAPAAPQKDLCASSTDEEDILGSINETISKAASESIATWLEHDAKQTSFCVIDEEPPEDQIYVDLTVNPERYTGYKGPDAHRIWKAIYEENCFKPAKDYTLFTDGSGEMCFEKRVFYRAVSGLHASINIHLTYKYLHSGSSSGIPQLLGSSFVSGTWGPNLEEFHRRFDPDTTNGRGPQWLRNLYFLYLLELRALTKAAPFLESENFYTGNPEDDLETKMAVREVIQIAKSFEYHFNESTMFSGGSQALKLKEEFRQHFFNVSRIMDCVGCQKCRLWGKLQTQGLGTALKILFSGDFDSPDPTTFDLQSMRRTRFKLTRNEIVALFNAFGRLSNSIAALEHFRRMAAI